MTDTVKITVERRITPVLITPSEAIRISTPRQGPPGADGVSSASFEFTQSVPALIWTINHNLGIRPSVMLFTTGGVQLDAEVVHTSLNQCLVYFVVATAGSARLN